MELDGDPRRPMEVGAQKGERNPSWALEVGLVGQGGIELILRALSK